MTKDRTLAGVTKKRTLFPALENFNYSRFRSNIELLGGLKAPGGGSRLLNSHGTTALLMVSDTLLLWRPSCFQLVEHKARATCIIVSINSVHNISLCRTFRTQLSNSF